jgi:hypothetical protein
MRGAHSMRHLVGDFRLDSSCKSCDKVFADADFLVKVLIRLFVASGLPLLAACAAVSLESQTKTLDRGLARIYFLRESMYLAMAVAPSLKVDGQEVGQVGNGSYFFVDRPLGTHTITLETPMTPGRFAAEVNLRPGGVYYLRIAPRVESYLIGAAAGVVGLLVEASVSENSGAFSLLPIDERSGAALLAQLKHS